MSIHKPIRVVTRENFEEIADAYNLRGAINPDIFDNEQFCYITVNINSDPTQARIQPKVTFFNDAGEKVTLTQTQCSVLIPEIVMTEWEKAINGFGSFFDRPLPLRKNLSENGNFYSVIKMMRPKLHTKSGDSENDFIDSLFIMGDGWDQARRNFARSQTKAKVFKIELKNRFVCTAGNVGNYTEDEVREISEEIESDLVQIYNTKSLISRCHMAEKAKSLLKKKTGWEYSLTEYSFNSVWYDKTALEMAKYLTGDFFNQLCRACVVYANYAESMASANAFFRYDGYTDPRTQEEIKMNPYAACPTFLSLEKQTAQNVAISFNIPVQDLDKLDDAAYIKDNYHDIIAKRMIEIEVHRGFYKEDLEDQGLIKVRDDRIERQVNYLIAKLADLTITLNNWANQ